MGLADGGYAMSWDASEDRYTGLAWAVVARIPTVLMEVRERLAGQPDYAAFLDEPDNDIAREVMARLPHGTLHTRQTDARVAIVPDPDGPGWRRRSLSCCVGRARR